MEKQKEVYDDEPTDSTAELQVSLSSTYGYAVTFDEQAEDAASYAVVDGMYWKQPVPEELCGGLRRVTRLSAYWSERSIRDK